jgi:hypothetical protein
MSLRISGTSSVGTTITVVPHIWQSAVAYSRMVLQNGVYECAHQPEKDRAMQFVKIHIAERGDRAKALEAITVRGRVICLPDNIFLVPEPALAVLQSLAVDYQELERGGLDYAEKALRDSLAGEVQRRATG